MHSSAVYLQVVNKRLLGSLWTTERVVAVVLLSLYPRALTYPAQPCPPDPKPYLNSCPRPCPAFRPKPCPALPIDPNPALLTPLTQTLPCSPH